MLDLHAVNCAMKRGEKGRCLDPASCSIVSAVAYSKLALLRSLGSLTGACCPSPRRVCRGRRNWFDHSEGGTLRHCGIEQQDPTEGRKGGAQRHNKPVSGGIGVRVSFGLQVFNEAMEHVGEARSLTEAPAKLGSRKTGVHVKLVFVHGVPQDAQPCRAKGLIRKGPLPDTVRCNGGDRT